MRKRAIAAALSVFGVALICSTGAEAALTELTVRIEGAEKTLFEGPIATEGHDVQASSDAEPRPCDATNNGAHPDPGPTPTAASVDAMELIGEGFNGEWYPGFDDYFIQRWGPDAEDEEAFAYWGILVNGAFTPVGGCQYLASEGDEVLWAYDAFTGRQLLWLGGAGDLGYPPAPTASVEAGEPLDLVVENGEQPSPSPADGITIAPVATAEGTGYQTVETGSSAAVVSNADGEASVTFPTPGWHRIKAQQEAGFLRSNRLDVCVEPPGGGSCGPLPADADVRTPPRYLEEEEEEEEESENPQPPGGGTPPPPPPPFQGPPKPSNRIGLRKPALNRAKGTARLKVALPGPGQLLVSGGRIVTQRRNASGPRVVTVPINPKGRARAQLTAKGRLAVSVRLRFTPRGGEPSTRKRTLTLKLSGGG